jgi:hypothetical protein
VFALIVFSIVACGPLPTQGTPSAVTWGGDVMEVTLKDGTRCAVLLGANRGGITCDWQHPQP